MTDFNSLIDMSSYDSFRKLFILGCKVKYRETGSYYYYDRSHMRIKIHEEHYADSIAPMTLYDLYHLFCVSCALYMDTTELTSFQSVRYI